jgi:hypothetical protein
MCLLAKDHTVISAFPLLPPPPLLLCRNVSSSGNNNNFDGGGSNEDTRGNSSFVGACAPLFFC